MCGRYKLTIPKELLWSKFDVKPGYVVDYQPRYNIAPTSNAPVIRMADVGRVAEMMRWGLIPHWSKEPTTKFATFNARSEDAANKPTYRGPMRYRRCLVPMDGFYEWKKLAGGAKQPYCIRMADEQPFALAGLWDCWGDELQSYTILTTEPNEMMAKIHTRMPVVLDVKDYERWLDPWVTDAEKVADLLKPYPAELMLATAVGDYVNSTRHEGTQCVEEVKME